MSRIQILRHGEETAFSKPIKRALLRDNRISYGARGLFAMLWDFPTDWVFHANHIVRMSPHGMTQLKSYIKELRNIGAIEIRRNQLTLSEAESLNELENNNYKVGQIIGSKWILNNPDLWAIETNLTESFNEDNTNPPRGRFSTSRETQQSVKPAVGKPTTKGLKEQGLEIKEPPPQRNLVYPHKLKTEEHASADTLLNTVNNKRAQELLDELAARINNNQVRNPLGYLRSLVQRDKSGKFIPELGLNIAKARKNKQEEANKKAPEVKRTKPEDIPKKLNSMHSVLKPKNNTKGQTHHE